jgi:6-phosphogluconolactonase
MTLNRLSSFIQSRWWSAAARGFVYVMYDPGVKLGTDSSSAAALRYDQLAMDVYVGSFTKSGIQAGRALGVSVLRFDPGRALGVHDVFGLDADPSWVQVSSRTSVVYAAAHTSRFEGQLGGAVVALARDQRTGRLTRLGQQPIPFPHPNHLSLTKNDSVMLVASGLGAGITVLPIHSDGRLAEASFVVHHDGTALIPFGRTATEIPPLYPEGSAYPHCVIPDPAGRHVIVADPALNRVISYSLDAERCRVSSPQSCELHRGARPRMLAFHPDGSTLYAANEGDSTVSTLRYDYETGGIQETTASSTIAGSDARENKPGGIAVHASGRFLFVSNRGHDTIAAFAIGPAGALERMQLLPSAASPAPTKAGAHPRHLALTPDGHWLFVANTYADNVSVLSVDQSTGRLEATGVTANTPTPTCVAFAPLA